MIKLSKEDKFFTIKKSAIDIEKAQVLDSLKELDKKVKTKKEKNSIIIQIGKKKHIKIKLKHLIDFDEDVSCVKKLAVKKRHKNQFKNAVLEWKNVTILQNIYSKFCL